MTASTMAWACGPDGTRWDVSTICRIRCCLKATTNSFIAMIRARKTGGFCSFPMGFDALGLQVEDHYYQDSYANIPIPKQHTVVVSSSVPAGHARVRMGPLGIGSIDQ